ncbi:diguanylate cyclase [Gorillibacterium sp. sgz5001074]|uniref:GGDEF domain-containing protein n=1 Tax=Gorillibacterium sp. sgz5001074 TaxID=3446695 RepID=UPI003F6649E9
MGAKELTPSPVWYRRTLNVHWLLVVGILLVESARLQFLPEEFSLSGQYRYYLIQQGSLLAAALVLTELISLFQRLRTDYTLITGCHAVMMILIVIHRDVILIPVLVLVPLLLGTLTYKKSRIAFSFCLSGPSYLALLFLPGMAIAEHGASLATFSGFFLTLVCMAYRFVARGEEILRHLENTHSAHQELLVKNIIMDKLFKLDALTELYNHKTFHEYLEKLIEQSERNGLPLQLAILDLDNFKKVNDTYGHHVGDIVLMRTATVLRQAVTPNDFVARYGGEEFAIIFTEKTIGESYGVLERIRAEMERLPHEELGFRAVTCSIGLEEYQRGTGKDFLFKNADASLYAAKKRGKNQISSTGMSAIKESVPV